MITGCVGSVDPDTPAAGCLVNTMYDANPVILKGELWYLDGVRVRLGAEASKVKPVPNLVTSHPEKVATPLVVVDEQPWSTALNELVSSERETVALEDVTTLPKASSMSTTGCVENAVAALAAETPLGWAAKTNWVADPA